MSDIDEAALARVITDGFSKRNVPLDLARHIIRSGIFDYAQHKAWDRCEREMRDHSEAMGEWAVYDDGRPPPDAPTNPYRTGGTS